MPELYSGDESDRQRLASEDGLTFVEANKPVRKPKSRAQSLQESKSILSPRKHARTEAEKETRRSESVSRNWRPAKASRECKRLDFQAPEMRNKELEITLRNAQEANLVLVEELDRFLRNFGVVFHESSLLEPPNDDQTALCPELFSFHGDSQPV
ncbi:transcription factor that binds to CRE motif [Beauveria asiatica]|uniref:Transcription factor that binds to CRE motif n=1 Tax=Beauveria asiatica TaxID=1069075 RepID=A0AAW0RSN3_9HYPO